MIFKNVVAICNSHKRIFLFAAKAGTFLEAIILPEDVREDKLLDKLRDLTADLETTLHGVDPDTGEVIA